MTLRKLRGLSTCSQIVWSLTNTQVLKEKKKRKKSVRVNGTEILPVLQKEKKLYLVKKKSSNSLVLEVIISLHCDIVTLCPDISLLKMYNDFYSNAIF